MFEKGIDQANSSLVKNTTSANTYTGYVKANIKTTDLNVGGTINYAIDYSGQKILLDNDTKKEQIFYGLDPYSRESLEREEVFEYYYKLGKTDEDIGKIWYDLRQKIYNKILKNN